MVSSVVGELHISHTATFSLALPTYSTVIFVYFCIDGDKAINKITEQVYAKIRIMSYCV